MTRRVVLVGVGHAHLHIIKNAATLRRFDAEVTIVAQDDFWYSGMATGMLGGLFPVEADRVDIGELATRAHAELHRGTMIGIDDVAREVLLGDGRRIGFDLLSLNLGSVPVPLSGKERQIYSVKPVRSLVILRQRIEDEWRKANPAALRVAVVGAGVTGVEIAANLRSLSDLHGQSMEITVYNRSEPLKHLPRGAAAALIRHLRSIDIEVRWPAAVTSVEENCVFLDDGTREDCDIVVNATGLVPAGICARLGLPVDADGALFVDRFLRSACDHSVFAVGDRIAFEGRALPRAGVYAVRQALVLLADLCAALADKPLTPFVPQRHYLAIVGLGRNSALMVRGPSWFKGPPCGSSGGSTSASSTPTPGSPQVVEACDRAPRIQRSS